ncbi:transposase IS200-like protein [Halobacteriovorax sp. BALOs_7]|uniref:transposase n=1 Tax=Halobacteriovorax sp. BALOs_7 TaxID=2109558 RepID=UPI000EA3299D|nr:transposase [Halobacteriovorax sp. BALOs_7]AYF44798.1 transposase IS200-like protein [Halobacteriovorax sp. BALOs_7]
MPRPKLIRQSKFPYHVTSRTNNKVPFPVPIYKAWDFCKESLIYAGKHAKVEVNCFVLMNNHYHLLVTTPYENIDHFMKYFNMRFSILLRKASGHINHRFSNRYKWSIVEDEQYLQNVYRYIFQNPVRASVVEKCIDYPYSSLHFTHFESKLINYRPHFHYANDKAFYERKFSSNTVNIFKRSFKYRYFKISKRISTFEKEEFKIR